jgi:hypothetical protein
MKCTFHLVVLLIFSLSCVEEPINDTCANPIGTDTDSMIRSTPTYDYPSCFQEKINNCFRFDFKNGIPLFQSVKYGSSSGAPLFKDMGELQCLKQVTEKPQTGLVAVTEIKLHHGYAIKLSDGTYGRFFVDSWETGSNGVTIVNITRQYSY